VAVLFRSVGYDAKKSKGWNTFLKSNNEKEFCFGDSVDRKSLQNV
jgi:hypothetical protein